MRISKLGYSSTGRSTGVMPGGGGRWGEGLESIPVDPGERYPVCPEELIVDRLK